MHAARQQEWCVELIALADLPHSSPKCALCKKNDACSGRTHSRGSLRSTYRTHEFVSVSVSVSVCSFPTLLFFLCPCVHARKQAAFAVHGQKPALGRRVVVPRSAASRRFQQPKFLRSKGYQSRVANGQTRRNPNRITGAPTAPINQNQGVQQAAGRTRNPAGARRDSDAPPGSGTPGAPPTVSPARTGTAQGHRPTVRR